MDYIILLVEDEEQFHTLLPLYLMKHKLHTFTVHSARHGKAGVEQYSKLANRGKKPDLVLMDIKMPVMNGVEATRKIMDDDPAANIYLFTAYAGTEVERNALDAGAKGTLSKAADWTKTAEEIVNILKSA
ncbi:MAG: response regulator transcription factor [Euryarchaeota archaeon]|nr:response regulator transcription factor [Euryarchaeota archaeon]